MTAPYSSSRFAYEGTETTETSIVRTGGAEDPAGQAQSRRIVTTANCQWLRPFRCAPWAIWNETVGADVTVTVYGMSPNGSLPLTDEVFTDVEYLADASSTLGKIVSTSKANVLAAGVSLASDSSVWGTGSHAFESTTANGMTLSNSDLTVTKSDSSTNAGVYVLAAQITGKYYFEIKIDTVGTSTGMGLIKPGANYNTTMASGLDCVITYGASGNISSNDASSGKNVGGFFTNHVMGLAVDFGARKAWFRRIVSGVAGNWNGLAIGSENPVTGLGGVTVEDGAFAPFVVATAGGAGSAVWTANFGATAYASAAPSGFNNWDFTLYSFKLVATLASPQPGRPGLIHVRPKIGKASATVYLDPQIELTPASAAPSATHRSSRYAYEGTETTETSIVRSGGTAHSRRIVTTANSQWLRPYRAEPFAVWNDTVGADVTVTVYGEVIGALPTNEDVFMDVEYLGDASSTLGKIVSTSKANVLATGASVASDSSTWAGPSPVSPPSLTGLIAWYDATITSSLNLTGANVGSINDQSGAGNHIVPISFTAQYDAVGFNGHPGVMFSSTLARGYVRNPFAMGTGNTLTIFGVWYVNSASGDYCRMMSYTAAAASHDYNNNGSWLFARNSNLSETFFARNTINSIQPYGYATPHRIIVTIRSDGTTVFYVDGVAQPTASPLAAAWVSGGVLGIGTSSLDSPAGNRFDGAMGECGVATGYSDPATVASLDAYLAAKWGLTGGSYTPFKLVATLSSPQPGQPGLINVRVRAARPSSTFYIDPTPILEPASSLGGGGGGEPIPPDPDVYDPATGDEAPVMQIAVDVDALSASFAANAISSHGTSPAGTTFSSNFWTSPSASLKYATPTDVNSFLFAGTYHSRDHALTGWCRNGEVFLRLVGGKAWSFRFNFEGAGGLTISLKEGITQTTSPPGSSATATYQAYGTATLNADILAEIPAYDASDTEGHRFRCVAEGLDLVFFYSLDGSSFTRIKRLTPVDAATWLHMADGAVAIANITTYGWRDFTIDYNDDPVHLYSDFTETLDVRDFGVRDVQTTGSMTSGSPTLIVDDATGLDIDDFVIVDTTGATGAGAPGGRGPGGQWPSLRYPNQTAMAADLTRPVDTACSLEDTGYVWHFDGAAWQRDATWNPDYIYMHKSHPMALRAKIIGKSGTILTLNQNAQVTVGSSRVYHDSQPLLAFLADTQDFHVDVPEVELLFPNSRIVMGAALNIQGHAGWSLRGAGSGRANSTPSGRTRFYAPLGCSTEINITNAFTSVRDIHIDSGGYLDFPQVDAAGMAQTTYGVIWPHGIVFTLVSSITVDNCNFTQPFQQAVAFRYCTTATVSNCTTRMPDPLGSYIQWNYQSANSTGIRFIDCELDADYMTCFCEPFQDDGTEYIRCIARNGISSNNTAVNTRYTDCGSILEALSRYSTNSQSIYNPVLQSNSNIGPGSPSTMTVDRFRYLLEGYVDVAREQPRGVIMSSSAGSILSNSNFEMLPYDLASALNGAQGVTCDSSDCTISSVRVDGTTVGDWAGNITAYDAANSGTDIVNCIADRQTNSQTGGTVTGAQTVAAAGTDRAPAAVSFTPVVGATVGQTYTSNEIVISGVNALLRNVTLTSNAKLIWLGNGVVPPVGNGTVRDHDHWVRKILRDGDRLKLQAVATAGTVTVTLQLATGQSYNWTITA